MYLLLICGALAAFCAGGFVVSLYWMDRHEQDLDDAHAEGYDHGYQRGFTDGQSPHVRRVERIYDYARDAQ